MEPRIGKLLVWRRWCLDPVLTIAASLAHRSPFVMPLDRKDRADAAKLEFANMSCSDHLAVLHAYDEWQRHSTTRTASLQRYLNKSVLRMMRDMRMLLGILLDAGFVQDDGNSNQASSSDQQGEGGRGGGNSSSRVNSKRGEECLVRAVLTAESPQVAAVRNGARQVAHARRREWTRTSSVNYSESQFEYQWMVYNEKVKSTGGIYAGLHQRLRLGATALRRPVERMAAAAGGGESGGGGETYVSMLEGYVTLERRAARCSSCRRWAELDARCSDASTAPSLTTAAAVTPVRRTKRLRKRRGSRGRCRTRSCRCCARKTATARCSRPSGGGGVTKHC